MSAEATLSRNQWLRVGWLATRDLWHQRLASLVLIASLASVLTPLLVLFGLKFGVIDNLVQELVQNPRNREIRLIGHGRFDPDWFDAMAAREDIAFVAPRTRGAAANADLRAEGSDRAPVTVELIPSGPGDPLLEGHAQPPLISEEAVITARVAGLLEVAPGDRVMASVRRKRNGQWSRVQVPLRVRGVVPNSVYDRKAVFVTPILLTAVEDYRDGYAVPALGWGDGKPFDGPRHFSGFRLYVRHLDDVPIVRDLLSAAGQGYEVSTRARAIEEVRRFDRYLTAAFFMIALIGVAGYLLSFGASMWVNVDRKRRELSVLQLLGFRSATIMVYPLVQSGLVAILGGLFAVSLFWLISLLINDYFARQAGQFEGLCRLLPSHLFVALLATLLCALAAASLAALRTTRIEASRGLREL